MAEATKRSLIRDMREITEKEKIEVLNLWKNVEKDYIRYGRLVFTSIFQLHPQLMRIEGCPESLLPELKTSGTYELLFQLYPNYKRFFIDILDPDEDPFDNAQFQKHMLQVLLPTLGGVVQNLDNPEAVYEAMKRLGFMHKRREFGLRKENVMTLGQCVVGAFKNNMDNMSEEQEAALEKVLNVVLAMFSNALEGRL